MTANEHADHATTARWRHEPDDYVCPFCALIAGEPTAAPRRSDLVVETDLALALISPRWWPRNPGHVLVIPRVHHENLYSMSTADLHAVTDLVQQVAIAIRDTYACDGTSTRQHNEPAGGQDVWHFHVHVFPRTRDDDLYATAPLARYADPGDRASFARRLREHPIWSAGHAAHPDASTPVTRP